MCYTCASCGRQFPIEDRRFRCDCGGFFRADLPALFPREALAHRDFSIWRYREAYGLPADLEPVSLGEGRTPIIERSLGAQRVRFKLDFLQPSGSFKDRGASVLLSLARHIGVAQVVEDSSGNAGAAVSAYAAAAGIGCTIYTPDYTPAGKLAQIELYGARVVKVPGQRQDANTAAIHAAESAFYASHIWNPFFVRGLASAAFEIWEQCAGDLPRWVIVPVGSGGYLEGLYLGFRALVEAGYARRMPRLLGVQALRCSPIHSAFERGLPDFAEVDVESTVAEGIAVQRPVRASAVLSAIRASQGCTVGVSEGEILAATKVLAALGILVEPTSAAVLAAWRRLDRGTGDDALLILTGSGLKQTQRLSELLGQR